MKKFFVALVCAVLAALTIVGFTACNNGNNSEPQTVSLVNMGTDATGVVPRDDIDYYVVPEPAASVKIKATSSSPNGFKLVGDLQQLYGGDKGYPQAVVVVKNSLLSSGNGLGHFMGALTDNASWLKEDSTEISTIVGAVAANLPSGTEPAFNANNLTKSIIDNCGIKFTKASDDKSEIKSFLTDLKAVQPSVNDSPADSFFFDGDFSDEINPYESLEVYAPDGAPALALAGLMAGEVATNYVAENINYHIVDASTIQTHITGATPNADICILPVNLAANLLGNGENYTMLGTVTHGNLYVISAKTSEQITVDNLSVLRGKTVGVVNLGAVPGLTFKLILNKNGIEYADSQS